jgi:hypothetical protein
VCEQVGRGGQATAICTRSLAPLLPCTIHSPVLIQAAGGRRALVFSAGAVLTCGDIRCRIRDEHRRIAIAHIITDK